MTPIIAPRWKVSPSGGGLSPSSSLTGGDCFPRKIVDAGDAKTEVDPGDWVILKVREPIDLPALNVDMTYDFAFASPIFRSSNIDT